MVLLGRETTGTIAKIQPGFSPQVKSDFIFGIGMVTVLVSTDVAEKTVSGFVLGPLVLIRT